MPSLDPTLVPSFNPSMDPSATPSAPPTFMPSKNLFLDSTLNPSAIPTKDPSRDSTFDATPDPTLALAVDFSPDAFVNSTFVNNTIAGPAIDEIVTETPYSPEVSTGRNLDGVYFNVLMIFLIAVIVGFVGAVHGTTPRETTIPSTLESVADSTDSGDTTSEEHWVVHISNRNKKCDLPVE